jgi:hydroxyacylglutathione hydrolase
MAIKIHMLTLGIAETNCFIVGDEQTRDAVVIDAPDDAKRIHAVAEKAGWTIREILATHAHFDHVLAVGELKSLTNATFRLHRGDLDLLHDLPEWMTMITGQAVPPAPEPDIFVDEGDVITVGGIRLEVLFTPGHAPGHVAYVMRSDKVVFSGDCLFENSIGRVDLPGGDYETLMRTISDKLLPLGDDYKVAPGHMSYTTIGRERMSNPYIYDWTHEAKR